jgi:hypothetical protein
MAKAYFVQFTDKITKKVFYKFGHTSYNDALRRFQYPEYDSFDIKCIASLYGQLETVQLIELFFLAAYPKNIWLEEYLGDERTWDNFSGITEIVTLDETKYKEALKTFYRLKEMVKKWETNHSFG